MEAETKWPPISRRYFHMHFLEWRCINFNQDFTEICSKCSVNNFPSLVQITAWRRPGDKPLSEPVMVNFLTHICVTRPQWVKVLKLKQEDECYHENAIVVISSTDQHKNPLTFNPSSESPPAALKLRWVYSWLRTIIYKIISTELYF